MTFADPSTPKFAAEHTARSTRRQIAALVALLIPGAVGCVYAHHLTTWNSAVSRLQASGIAFFIAGVICAVSPGRKIVARAVRGLRCPTPAAMRRLSIAVAIGSSGWLLICAMACDRDLAPRLHDEKSYTLQSRMLAHGMLWRQPHSLPQFFESFFIFSDPLYGSKYFPGAMMLYVPGVWLGIPDWVTSLLIAGAVCGATCLVATELTTGQGIVGVIAALLLLSVDAIQDLGTWVLAHEPVMLGGLILTYAWLRWRATGNSRCVIVIGVVAGWSAITRPIDAFAYALPILIVLLIDLRRGTPALPARTVWRQAMLALLLMVPFFALQGIFDEKMTGFWFKTPYTAYIERYDPGDAYGEIAGSGTPQTHLQQKLDFHNRFIVPLDRQYLRDGPWRALFNFRVPTILTHAFGSRFEWLLVPAGLLAVWRDRRALPLLLLLPLWLALYLLNPTFIWYYPVIVAPAIAILLAVGVVEIIRCSPARIAAMMRVAVPTFAVAVGLGAFPELFGHAADFQTVTLPKSETFVKQRVAAPALVFFHYNPHDGDAHFEPVYNLVTGWPDDEPITRAQDLGPEENMKLIRYYARIQPDRNIYLIDRGLGTGKRLGTAAEMANRPRIIEPAD